MLLFPLQNPEPGIEATSGLAQAAELTVPKIQWGYLTPLLILLVGIVVGLIPVVVAWLAIWSA